MLANVRICFAHFTNRLGVKHFSFLKHIGLILLVGAVLLVSNLVAVQIHAGLIGKSVSRTILSASESIFSPPVELTAPTASHPVPSTFTVPITVDDITSDQIIACQFRIVYDPTVMDPSGSNFGCSTAGTIAGNAGSGATCNISPDGTLRVSINGSNPMVGSGALLNVTFTTDPTAEAGDISPLNFTNVQFFGIPGPVATTIANGQITLVAPVVPVVSATNTTAGAEPGTANVFNVSLSSSPTSAVTVNYATSSGTATSGNDFTPANGTITFPAGTAVLTQTVSVLTLDDPVFEGPENFNFTLSSPTNATIAGTNPAIGTIADNETQPTVSIANTTSGGEPSTGNVFTVTLSGQTSSAVTVNYATANGTASAGSDYSTTSGTVTFAANTTTLTQTIPVPTLDDLIFEGSESFTMGLSGAAGATINGGPATGTIADDETQPTLSVARTTSGAEPATANVFTVTLSGRSSVDVTVHYETSSGTATTGSDLTGMIGDLTFAANTSTLTQTITVATLDDTLFEGTENFNLTLSAPLGATIIGTNPAIGLITDDEGQPTVSIAQTTPGTEPSTANVFTVTLSGQSAGAVNVNYATASGTAVSGIDFTSTSGTITFAANTAALTQTFSVPVVDDNLFEGSENFTVALSAPTNATIAGTNPATGNIADNEAQPTVSIALTTPGGEPTNANVFTVSLSGQTTSQVTVAYATANGSATAGSDYTPMNGTVTFAPNTSTLTQTVSVPTLDDLVLEGTENFTITLSAPINATITGNNPATGIIADNESQPVLTIANTTSGAEPATANVFTVTLSGQTASAVTVNYATSSGTATSGSDFTATSGTLTFAANTSTLTQTVSVPTLNDSIFEGTENFTMTLSGPTNSTIAGTNPATGSIADNETQPTVSISSTTAGAEPSAASTFTVTLSGQTTSIVSVNYATSSGTAISGSDFTATNGTVTFAANTAALTQTVNVPTLDDLVFEGSESFNMTLSAAVNASISGNNPAIGTITDNESQPTVSIALTSPGSEPSTANVFTVTLSGRSASTVAVNYATGGGTAVSGGDYTATSGTITFAANTTTLTQSVSVATLDDITLEGSEAFNMTLSAPTNATISGTNPAVGTISDDESPRTVSIVQTTGGGEPATSNVFTVSLSGQTNAIATVNYATANGSAVAGSDYTATTGTITFAANTVSLTQTISVPTLDDLVLESNETFTIGLSGATNATISGTNPATGTIVDNEVAPSPTPTPIASPTPTPAVPTPTPTPTPTPVATPTPSPTPSPVVTPTPSPTPLATPTPTPTPLPSPTPTVAPSPTPTPAPARDLRIVNTFVQPGNTVVVSVFIDALGNEASTSFSLNFNPNVLTNPLVALGNGVPSSSNLGTNLEQLSQGRIGILIDSTNAYLPGTRQVMTITFTVPANAMLGLYPVTFGSSPVAQSVSSTGGALLATNYMVGTVQVGSTASRVELSGRVLTADGRGLRNATVRITDQTGVVRTATTSSFGYYRFEQVDIGSTFVMAVSSKRYRYQPRVVQVFDTLVNVNFVGLE